MSDASNGEQDAHNGAETEPPSKLMAFVTGEPVLSVPPTLTITRSLGDGVLTAIDAWPVRASELKSYSLLTPLTLDAVRMKVVFDVSDTSGSDNGVPLVFQIWTVSATLPPPDV